MDGHRVRESRQPRDGSQRDLILTAEEAGEQILVVSDLHLGIGREAGTGRFEPQENFFADDEFGRFLKTQAGRQNGPGLLVLNGDIIDFVRITRVPTPSEFDKWREDLGVPASLLTDDDLVNSIDVEERTFGLRTHQFKSVWRVRRVIQGHPQFFSSLSWWLEKGGRVVFVKGNHDLELYWPLVQKSIRREIDRRRTRNPIFVSNDVLFADRGVQIENIYLEHGHRFEAATTVYGDATTNNGREIRLPLGSVVNRYLINKLEEFEPFLNNLKPVDRAVQTVARRYRLRFWGQFFRAAPNVCRSVRRNWFRNGIGIVVFFCALMAQLVFLVALTVLVALAAGFLILLVAMPMVDLPLVMPGFGFAEIVLIIVVIGAPVLKLLKVLLRGAYRALVALRSWIRRQKNPDAEDSHAQGLFDHLRELQEDGFAQDADVIYGVVGHTHRPDVQVLDLNEQRRFIYLNSGTWIPYWSERRANLRSGTEYSFLRFDWKPRLNQYRYRSLVWRDDRGVQGGSVENVIIARS